MTSAPRELPSLSTIALSLHEDGVAVLTLNRPDKLNALNAQLIGELDEALTALRAHDVRGLVVTGAGRRAFAAGADIAEMVDHTSELAHQMAKRGQSVLDRLAAFPAPTVAAVNGFALGGGCELAMCCDLILAGPNAVFGQPEVKIGVIPGFGGTQRLVRRVGQQRALELVMSGRNVQAEEAVALGLALEVTEEDVLDAALTLVRRIARNAPLAVRRAKAAVHEADTLLSAGLSREATLFGECFDDADQTEGMSAFIAKRRPKFQGQ